MPERRSTDPEVGPFVLPIDERWNLTDLSEFPRVYEQAYSFLTSFYVPKIDQASLEDEAEAEFIFRSYPWRGGYSAVNFYNNLKFRTPRSWRPTINSIHYASPGAIELVLVVTIANNLKVIVGHLVAAADQINKLYGRIQKGIIDRKLQKIKIREKELVLDRAEVSFALESCEQLAAAMGFQDLVTLHRRTGNPVASLRILLSFYRRLKKLADFDKSGKAKTSKSGPKPSTTLS